MRSVSAKFPRPGSILVRASAGILQCGTHLTTVPSAVIESRTIAISMALRRSALAPPQFLDS
eukprot:3288733-Pyramimonas_sp.AAC.1